MSSSGHSITPQEAAKARRHLLPDLIRDVEDVLSVVRANKFDTVGIAVTSTEDPAHIECELPTAALASLLSVYVRSLNRELSGPASVDPVALPDTSPQVRQFEMIGHVLKDASETATDPALAKLLARAGSHANVAALAISDMVVCMEELARADALPH